MKIKMSVCSASLWAVSERIVSKSYSLPTNTIPDMECVQWRNIKKDMEKGSKKKKKILDKL